ncbi:HAD family hydrolase [Parendozoicomonas haliclonae]|uniref:Putative HAD-hydrolase YfnB n=2 Tax=Parendozoicomonas haliclonae TaxID=1960125 RepID=A0A1X7AKB1_9GAMM|nr:putative HAD-hydrolase YfnB [Parendozoicomonas haliclonae]
MVDFPESKGKMCDWEYVEAVDGAFDTLSQLSISNKIYIATNAEDSSVNDIAKAFERVNLDRFIDGYFCFENLGIRKGTREFIDRIVRKLDVPAHKVTMVGDSLENDILPAIEAGLNTYWLYPAKDRDCSVKTRKVNNLHEIVTCISSDQI